MALGLILPDLESAPTRLVPRYVYHRKVLIPLVSTVSPLQPQSRYVGQSGVKLYLLPHSCYRIGFGSLSLPSARLEIQNVVGFRTIPAPNRVGNTRHALGLSYCR